jgi:hypothetical protein
MVFTIAVAGVVPACVMACGPSGPTGVAADAFAVADHAFGVAADAFSVADTGFVPDASPDVPQGVAADAFSVADVGFGPG